MCLAVFAIDVHADWPLVLLANRDEFHARPTQAMQPWPEAPQLLAGRDLQAGGTWLGMTNNARLALLTNVRDPKHLKHDAPSRGQLTQRFLRDNASAQHYLDGLANEAAQYNGFNLVLIDTRQSDTRQSVHAQAWHASNYQSPFSITLAPGVHGLSNALMNTPWPKTERIKQALSHYLTKCASIDSFALTEIMQDATPVDDALLPATGIGLPKERLLATPFIVSPDYGTRCTTLVLRHRSGACWVQEDSFNPAGERIQRLRWQHAPGQTWQPTQDEPASLNTD